MFPYQICQNALSAFEKLENWKIFRIVCLHFVNIALKKAFLTRMKRVQ